MAGPLSARLLYGLVNLLMVAGATTVIFGLLTFFGLI